MDAFRSACVIPQFFVLALSVARGPGSAGAAENDNRESGTTSVSITLPLPPPSAVIGLLGDLAFGSVPAGQTATHTLVITNSGSLALNVSGISCPPAFSGNWSGSIAPAGSQSVQVTFSPTRQSTYGGTLVVSSDAASGLGSLPASGTGYFPLTNYWSIWWQHTNGTLALWSMLGTNAVTKTQVNPRSPGSGWRLAGPTEFNGDGHIDLLFESSSGGVAAWLMNGDNRQTSSYLTPSTVAPTWQARGTADLNGNGGRNILWQAADGSVATWLMNGLIATQTARLNPPQVSAGWNLAATGDFNGDSKSDILWQNTDGRVAVWFMNGTNRSSVGYLSPNPGWRLAGSLDFNADGHPGLVWEHANGALAYWQMAGTNVVHSGQLNPSTVDPAWQIVGPSAQAAATIDTPTQAALEAALAGGGISTFACNGTIVLTNTILISHDTILDGNGYTVTISGGSAFRIFQVAAGVNFWVKRLTLSDGTVLAPNGVDGSPPTPGQDALGGAILCQGGNLTLTDCILSNNFVQGGHGGTETNPAPSGGISASGGMGVGGAIYASRGSLNLTNCLLLSNGAVGGLGSMLAYYPPGAGTGAGGSAWGGAIYMSNVTATLAQVTSASNRLTSGAAQLGGENNSGGPGGNSLGGAIYVTNSTVLIANSSFATNSAIAADATPGSGYYLGSGSGIGGALWVSQGSTATIQISSFSNNVAKGGGRAMGGAIANSGTLLLSDCGLSGNHALAGADGGIYGEPGRGGGVYAEGPLTINRCTFDNNQAVGGFAVGQESDSGHGGPGEGGALWSSSALMATNSTWATNLALGGVGGSPIGVPGVGGPGTGGAIFTSAGGTLVNLTLAYNLADSQSYLGGLSPPGPALGGGLAVTNSPPTVRGTIIADSSKGGDVWGVVTDAGYNICSDATAGFTATASLNNTDPLLGPLANNGGLTKTIALQAGSPALDKIPSGFPPTDQRGVPRPHGPAADIGAYEAQVGMINTPNQAALEAALAGGGTATFACNGTIVLTNTILISQDTFLDGNGYTVTISGGGVVRIFQVAPGVSFWVKCLTLSDGRVMAPNGVDGSPPSPGQDALGAALLSQGGNLTLTGCTLSNNFVQGGNAGSATNAGVTGAAGGLGAGGAIYVSQGTLNVTNCSLLSNEAVGGIASNAAYPGAAGSAWGGAIYMSNVTAILAQVTFTSNTLTSGVPQAGVFESAGSDALGGAICISNSTVLIANSSFTTSSAIAPGGFNDDGGYSGGGIGGALWVSQGSTATIQTTSFSNNVAQGGNGLRAFNAGPAMGGAIASSGTLLLSDCAFSGNQVFAGNNSVITQPGRGGGVYAEGPLTINRCTFDNNQTIGGSAVGTAAGVTGQAGPGEGGALWSSGILMATNCTCAANHAIGGFGRDTAGNENSVPGRGGAIFTSAGGMLINLTLAYNRADVQGFLGFTNASSQGGGLAATNSPPTARGTIIAKSSNGGDVWGIVTDAGYNICSDGTAGFTATGSLNNTDPLLGPLANNGGPTKTIALQAGSPALDKIPSGFPVTDQRGVLRPQGAAADIGAYEAPISITISRFGSSVNISFYAQGGISYELLSSTNLRTWVSVATNSIATSGPLSFVQSFSPGASTFYRVVTP